MAFVYLLFSKELDKYYTGSCLDLAERIAEHKSKKYNDSFTSKAIDWELYYAIDNLTYEQARGIEKHIKNMKSIKYIENLKKYPEISIKLIQLYKK